MAQKSGFFNSINGDRIYDAGDIASILSLFFTNGVFNNSLQVSASGENMSVVVSMGTAHINGYSYINSEEVEFVIGDADTTLNRIDSIILRLDLTNRQITLQKLEGAYASTPSQPSIVRAGNIYDLRLANILVSAGTTRITTDLITDTRFGSECGNVTQAVLSLDTSEIFAQYKQAFEDWFEELQVELDGDVATHLENQIISLEGNVGDLSDLKTTNKSDLVEAINELSVRKNIITAYLNEDYVIPTNDTYVGIPFDNSESMGTGLTLSDGGVVIGSGISKVKISSKICLPSSGMTAGSKNLVVRKNGTIVDRAWQYLDVRNSSMSTPARMISVSEGDVLTLAYYGKQNDKIAGNSVFTDFTVEAVEYE